MTKKEMAAKIAELEARIVELEATKWMPAPAPVPHYPSPVPWWNQWYCDSAGTSSPLPRPPYTITKAGRS